MGNNSITRRGFGAGMVAGLTTLTSLKALAIETASPIEGNGSSNEERSLRLQNTPLNQMSDIDRLYLTPTAWENSLSQSGSLSL